MELDDRSLEALERLDPREVYESVRRAVLKNPWGASSEDLQAAFEQLVSNGILTWDEIEQFEAR